MVFEINLSARARLDFLILLEYLSEEWTQEDLEIFYWKFEKLKLELSINPFLFSFYNREKEIHKVPLTKHNMVYYLVDIENCRVEIITIFNVFQNPKKLKL